MSKTFEGLETAEKSISKQLEVPPFCTEAAGLGKRQQPLSQLERKKLSDLLRIATVDNFQGEGAKFIIISLVRSNKEEMVGFLKTPNRINVLLSRAQHGIYLTGNADIYSRRLMSGTSAHYLESLFLGSFNRRNSRCGWQSGIAAIRLSLPARYLDPKRNTSLGESKFFHTSRLANLLEISLAALPMSMPKSLEPADHASLAHGLGRAQSRPMTGTNIPQFRPPALRTARLPSP